MPRYRVTFALPAEVTVEIEREDEEDAADAAWRVAEDYLDTMTPDAHGASFQGSLDGIGAERVEEI